MEEDCYVELVAVRGEVRPLRIVLISNRQNNRQRHMYRSPLPEGVVTEVTEEEEEEEEQEEDEPPLWRKIRREVRREERSEAFYFIVIILFQLTYLPKSIYVCMSLRLLIYFCHYEYTPAIYIQFEFCLVFCLKSKKVIGNSTSASEI